MENGFGLPFIKINILGNERLPGFLFFPIRFVMMNL